MWEEGIEDSWSRVAEGVMLEIREWREQHPKATFSEIEEAVDRLMAKARARFIQDAALASSRGASAVRVKMTALYAPGVGDG